MPILTLDRAMTGVIGLGYVGSPLAPKSRAAIERVCLPVVGDPSGPASGALGELRPGCFSKPGAMLHGLNDIKPWLIVDGRT